MLSNKRSQLAIVKKYVRYKRHSGNTIRLTEGERRRRKAFFVRKEKQAKEELKTAAGFFGNRERLMQYYKDAHVNFREFLNETKTEYKTIHLRTEQFLNGMNSIINADDTLIDPKLSLKIFQRERRMLKLSDNASLKPLIVSDSNSLTEPPTLEQLKRHAIQEKNINNFRDNAVEIIQKAKSVYSRNKSDLYAFYDEFLEDALKNLDYQTSVVAKRKITEQMICFVEEAHNFVSYGRVSIKQRSSNHRGNRIKKADYPTPKSIALILESSNKRRCFKDTLLLYNELANTFNVKNEIKTYIELMIACYNTLQPERSLKFFDEAIEVMEEQEVSISQEKPLVVHERNLEIYNLFLAALETCSKSLNHALEGEQVVELMKLRGIKLTDKVYAHLFSCYALLGDVESVKDVFDTLPNELKTLPVYNSYFYAVARSQWNMNRSKASVTRDFDPNEAAKELLNPVGVEEEIINDDQVLQLAENYEDPVGDGDAKIAFGGRGLVQNIYVPLEYLPEQERDPLENLYRDLDVGKEGIDHKILLEHYATKKGYNRSRTRMTMRAIDDKTAITKRNYDFIESINTEMSDRNLQEDVRCTRNILEFYAAADDEEEVENIVENILASPAEIKQLGTLTSACRFYEKTGDVEQAVNLSEQILQRHPVAKLSHRTVGVIAVAFASLETKEGFERCLDIIQKYKTDVRVKDLGEHDYQRIRHLFNKNKYETKLSKKLIPSDPNKWRWRVVIHDKTKEVFESKDKLKQVGMVVAQGSPTKIG